jgi:ABC-type thiamine transport system substrate-binding protein
MRRLHESLLGLILVPWLAHTSPIRVLTYSSMTAKGGWGTAVQTAFAKGCADCKIEWVTVTGNSSLLNRLREEGRRGKPRVHAVLGIEGTQASLALKEKLLLDARKTASSPYAIVVDTQAFPEKDWPKTWAEVPKKLGKELFVQDPRLSSVGMGWLLSIFSHKLLTLEQARELEKKAFPNWSSSYEAFTKGLAKAVWSYRSSEAYHRCEEKTDRYRVLPLAEGYPVQDEWVGLLPAAEHPKGRAFLEAALSEEAQSQIPTLNWMWPANTNVKVPKCFHDVTPIKTLEEKTAGIDARLLRDWTDRWGL